MGQWSFKMGVSSRLMLFCIALGPLYKHVFPPALAPGLSFVGLPFKLQAAPLPMFELQSNWVAGALSNRISLPSKEEMLADVKALYAAIEAFGEPKHQTHALRNYMPNYYNWLATTCGYPAYEEWRKEMYIATHINKVANLRSYRDDWHDDESIRQAYEEFSKYTTKERSQNHSRPRYKHVFPRPWPRGFPLLGYHLRIALPSKEEMLADVEAFYAALKASGKPKHQTHALDDYMPGYYNWLATICGCPAFEEWRKEMYIATYINREANLRSYRDDWHDDEFIRRAYEEFSEYTTNERSQYHSHI